MLDPALLKNVSLFAGLASDHLALVAALAEVQEHPATTVLFREGDVGDYFYIVLEGRVRISKIIPNAGEEALTILEPGAYFGEMALIDASSRSAQASAHTAVKLARIAHEAFAQLLFINRDLAYDVLWCFVRTLSGRLRDTNDKLKSFFAMTGGFG